MDRWSVRTSSDPSFHRPPKPSKRPVGPTKPLSIVTTWTLIHPDLFLDLQEDGTGFYALVDRSSPGALLGFCCFGEEARVVGQQEETGTLDLGGGLRPDLVSRGTATLLMPAVCRFAAERFDPERLRVVIAAFNERSIRLCRSARFESVRAFTRPDGEPFIELVPPAPVASLEKLPKSFHLADSLRRL